MIGYVSESARRIRQRFLNRESYRMLPENWLLSNLIGSYEIRSGPISDSSTWAFNLSTQIFIKMDKMPVVLVYLLSGLIFTLDTTTVPSIRDVFLQPLGFTELNVTVLHNSTCQQCICEVLSNNNSDYSALNCFTNGTCEFFPTFPLSYKHEPSMGRGRQSSVLVQNCELSNSSVHLN
jgi:hypothetical protein